MKNIEIKEAEAEAWSAIRGLDLDPDTFLDVPYLELLEAGGPGRMAGGEETR